MTRTARRIYLFGKAVGQTNIFVFGPNGEQIVSLDLAVERDVAGLEDYIKRFIPDADIKVELLNDNVVLTGTVETRRSTPSAPSSSRPSSSAAVRRRPASIRRPHPAATSNGGVDIDNPDATRRVSQIVNLLQIVGEDQVTLKVTVAEVSRTVMKQLGVNLISSGSGNGITWDAISNPIAGLGKPIGGVSGIGGSMLDAYFTAMEQSGVMKTLAEPTLTAVSGEKATFRVGGEFNLVSGKSTDPDTGQTTYSTSRSSNTASASNSSRSCSRPAASA